MRQVLLNLLENALKYTGNGGHITSPCSTAPAKGLSVRDSGPGILTEEQQRIFSIELSSPDLRPHHRVHGYRRAAASWKCMEGGSGRSEPGEGGFTFTVPIWQGQGQEWGQAVLTEGELEP